jgi:hypothetical protein
MCCRETYRANAYNSLNLVPTAYRYCEVLPKRRVPGVVII